MTEIKTTEVKHNNENCRAVLNVNRDKAPLTIEDEIKDNNRGEKINLFASFDLCNSSILKHKTTKWFEVLETFINNTKDFKIIKSWKFNGDEVLFTKEVTSLIDIIKTTEKIYEYLEKLKKIVNEKLKDENINNLHIKAAVWIAVTDDNLVDNGEKTNYRFNLNEMEDYAGTDIDEGFRLRGCSSQQKLVIDPKIAYVVHIVGSALIEIDKNMNISEKNAVITQFFLDNKLDSEECENFIKEVKELDCEVDLSEINDIITFANNLKMVGYKHCKGVWDDRSYPVIWYANNWDGIEKNIVYDEKFNEIYVDSFIKDIKHEKYKIKILEKIFLEVGNQKSVEKIIKELHIKLQKDVAIDILKKINIYYMVVCVNPMTKNALVYKRSQNRKHLKGIWDFGNVKHVNDKVDKVITKYYKDNFDIDIILVNDEKRENSYLTPFAMCTVSRYGEPHSGILCYAKIIDKRKDELTGKEIIAQLTDEEIIAKVNNKLDTYKEEDKDKKTYKYEDAIFINKEKSENYPSLDNDQIEIDSKNVDSINRIPLPENSSILNFKNSISDAINYIITQEENKNK